MTETNHVVVIGAGSAGLSTALSLRDRGRRALVVDKAGQVGAAWRGRYDRLRLNTGRDFSHLPGRPYPKGTPTFPSRDEVVAHLERHSREDRIELQLNTEIARIESAPCSWHLRTTNGDLHARHVVVAMGNQNVAIWACSTRAEDRMRRATDPPLTACGSSDT